MIFARLFVYGYDCLKSQEMEDLAICIFLIKVNQFLKSKKKHYENLGTSVRERDLEMQKLRFISKREWILKWIY